MTADGQVRISDDERAVYDQALRTAYAEGRITDVELEDRLTAVLSARYESDLMPVVSDLPAMNQSGSSLEEVAALETERSGWDDGGFFIAPVICTAIYAMTDFGGYFWPMWVWFGCMIPVVLNLFDRD